MPFVSQAQMRKFAQLVQEGKMKQSTFDEYLRATPNIHKLPDRLNEKVGKEKPNSKSEMRTYKKAKRPAAKKARKSAGNFNDTLRAKTKQMLKRTAPVM